MALKIESDTLCSINPRNGELISEFSATSPGALPEIISTARSAFEDWSSLTLKTRLELFRKAYRQFYYGRDEIAELISQETGKPLLEAYSSEILPVLDCFKYYIKNVPKLLKDQPIRPVSPLFKLRKGFVRYEPFGVVAIISPWNFPFLLAMQHIIPAILVGNAVIHKPSEHTTLTGLKIAEIFERAYLPKRVLNVVTGLAEVGQSLVQSKVDKFFFTGSTEVGKKVYISAAQNLVPVNMELGGSDPMIILEDANMDRAVNAAAWGAFSNAGQACLSVERVLVHESVMDLFTEKLVEKVRTLSIGGNGMADVDVSCVIDEKQLKKICSLIEDASGKGAIIQLGGKSNTNSAALFFEPTIIINVKDTMNLARHEIFGPIVSVLPFKTQEELIQRANNSDFGLSASVWTQDRKRGLRIANRIQAGSVVINDLQIHIAQMEAPYTGYKNSAIGVSHGPWSIQELVRPKYINSDRPFLRSILKFISKDLVDNNIWWYKYSEKLVRDFRIFTDFLHGDSLWRKVKSLPATVKALFRKDYL